MFKNQVDAKNSERIRALGQHVLSGGRLGRADGAWLLGLEGSADLGELMAWANRIREQRYGRRIHLCSIVNLKSGGCPEDCKFCAQSAVYQTDAARYGLIDGEPIRQAMEEAHAHGVNAVGLVAAWKELKPGPVLEEICQRVREMVRVGKARPDVALGMIRSQEVADQLKAAGVACYNHNLETSRRFFPQVCTTHGFEDRLQTIRHLKQAGIRVCCGGILGLGETRDDRCDLAFTLQEIDSDFVPVNILNPIPGTPFEHVAPLTPWEILKTVACFRFILPRPHILIAGGRVVNLRDAQSLVFLAGASALMVGNYLTTANQPVDKDLQMLKDLDLEPFRDYLEPDN
jgi:biotin synthase